MSARIISIATGQVVHSLGWKPGALAETNHLALPVQHLQRPGGAEPPPMPNPRRGALRFVEWSEIVETDLDKQTARTS